MITERDRPAWMNEIEVTPEMIKAGVDEFVCYEPGFEFAEDAIVWIFRAMIAAPNSPWMRRLNR